jgi:hypothetical protein
LWIRCQKRSFLGSGVYGVTVNVQLQLRICRSEAQAITSAGSECWVTAFFT